MAVLLTSGDLANVLELIRSRKITQEQGQEKLSLMISPLVIATSNRHPLYMRDDMCQELHLKFLKEIPNLVKDFHYGTYSDIIEHIQQILKRDAIDIFRARRREDCRFVKIDDLEIEAVVFPKTYEKTKIIMKVRKALESFYENRYPTMAYANRASKFAYLMLSGKRPSLTANNLRKFFHGNRMNAYNAYTTALTIIRQILAQYSKEIQCIQEE